MNVHGLIPGFPLPDNKCRGQFSREGQGGGGDNGERVTMEGKPSFFPVPSFSLSP